jgi:hypothetical protein
MFYITTEMIADKINYDASHNHVFTAKYHKAFVEKFGEYGMQVNEENIVEWIKDPYGRRYHFYALISSESDREILDMNQYLNYTGWAKLFIEFYKPLKKSSLVDKIVKEALQ